MRINRTLMFVVLTLGMWTLPVAASAQTLGTFSWQQTPYCNVMTLTVTQVGGSYLLSGFDDECGATTRSAVTGVAFMNLDSTIGMGLTVITAGARTFHLEIALNVTTFSGSWRSTAGTSGNWLLINGPRVPGGTRPAPAPTVVIETSGISMPTPLVAQARISDLNETFVTPRTARLSISKTISNATVLCSGIAAGFFFITLDGVPIRNSAVYANGGFSGVLSGVTVNQVAAGAHVLGIGMHCYSGNVTGGGHNVISISSVTLLP